MGKERFTIVAAVNDITVLQKNLYLSPGIKNDSSNQIIIKHNYRAASLAYNEAIEESKNDIILFVHQDVYFPETWFPSFINALSYFENEKINWGVLGCFGIREECNKGIAYGKVYSNGWGAIGREIIKPEPVQTLDEIVLVIKKSSGLRFDPTLPHFHMYGADICMSAKDRGMTSYVLPAFCIHNTNQIVSLTSEFYECYRHIKKRWKKNLPIHTPCIRISRFNEEIYERKIREIYSGIRNKNSIPISRVEDPRSLMRVD
jgi:hypothetical protein